MKCYKSPQEFAAAVCREKGQSRPSHTCYMVKDRQNVMRVERGPHGHTVD